MTILTRRRFAQGLLAGTTTLAVAGLTGRRVSARQTVIIGGGPAGIAAALALRAAHPAAPIQLIERDPTRLSTTPGEPFTQPTAGCDLDSLRRAGISVMLDEVEEIDWSASRLSLFSGRRAAFDDLLLAPGTAPVEEGIAGLDPAARHMWPAAWGNPREARRLAAQLSALPDKGRLVLRLPAGPLSHPQAALDRAAELAEYLARHRPTARLTVLDGSPDAPLLPRFTERTAHLHLAATWLPAGAGGTVLSVDAPAGQIQTEGGPLHADVANFVTTRRAGLIAQESGLADASGWCPCGPDGRSTLWPQAMILGDARARADRTLRGAERSARLATRFALSA